MIPKDVSSAAGASSSGGIGLDPISIVGGGLLGGIKSLLDLGKQKRQARIQAATTAFSPWTGMKAAAPEEANPYGDILQGAAQGAAFGQGLADREEKDTWGRLAKRRFETETALLERLNDMPYGADFGYSGGKQWPNPVSPQ